MEAAELLSCARAAEAAAGAVLGVTPARARDALSASGRRGPRKARALVHRSDDARWALVQMLDGTCAKAARRAGQQAARDLQQELLIGAWHLTHLWEPSDGEWMAFAAPRIFSMARTWVRREVRAACRTLYMERLPELAVDEATDELAGRRESVRRVRRAGRRLTERQRVVLRLRYTTGSLSFRAMGSQLGITAQAAQAHHAAALRRLRPALEDLR